MIAPLRTKKQPYTDEQVNARFLELMPHIKKSALISFASFRGERRDEAVQSVLVSAFQMLKQLAEQGRLEDAYATPLAKYAIGRYREGRPGGVSSCSTDVMGEHCQKLGRSTVRNFGLAERIADTFQSESAAADSRYPVRHRAGRDLYVVGTCRLTKIRDNSFELPFQASRSGELFLAPRRQALRPSSKALK